MRIKQSLLEEAIKQSIKKVLKEAAMSNFNPKEIERIQSFKGRLNYCIQNLGPVQGKGSSRAIFQIDDEKILKLAINQKGLAQNEEEGRPDYYKDDLGIFPIVYEHSPSGAYLISEFVLPAKKQDFKHCLGISFDEFCSFIKRAEIQIRGGRGSSWYTPMSVQQYRELIDKNQTLYNINDYIGSYDNVMVADLYQLGNYGMAMRNGKPSIVLLDSGYTEEIYQQYYRRR